MSAAPINERRRHARRKPLQLVYVEFGRENGGMVKDVSEGGMRFHLMNPVAVGQDLQFAVGIDAARRMEGRARMIWTDGGGKSGGMSFAELSEASRAILQAWLGEMDAADGNVAVVSAPKVETSAVPPAPETEPASVATLVRVAEQHFPSADSPSPVVASPAAPPAPVPLRIPAVSPAAPVALTSSNSPGDVREMQAAQAVPVISVASQLLPSAPQASSAREAPAALLEVGSQFISQPVSREEWQRAAREEIAPGERSRRPLAAAKVKAMRDEVLAASRAAAYVEATNGHSEPADEKAVEVAPAEAKNPEQNAQWADQMRDFLRQPIGGEVVAAPVDDAPSGVAPAGDFSAPRSTGWTPPRVAMILVLAAICGVVGALAGISYRQNIGEMLIRLGERISGEQRHGGNGDSEPVPAGAAPATNADSPASQRAVEKPAAGKKRTGETSGEPNAEKPPTPVNNPPITQEFQPPPATRAAVPQQPAVGQTQLAAGREILPGKPKRAPEDVASLWIAVENGDTAAEILLANRYAVGDGVDKNCDQARVLLQAAAKHGSELAAKRLTQLATTGCE